MKKILAVLVALTLTLSLCTFALAEGEEVIRVGALTPMVASKKEASQENIESVGRSLDVIYYDNLSGILLGLNRGEVSRIQIPRCTAEYIMAQNPGVYRFKAMSNGEVQSLYSLLTLDTQAELMAQLNAAIRELRADGTLAALEEAYLIPEAPDTAIELPVFEGAPTYRVLVTGDLPPMDYVSADGTAMGYNVALLKAISEKLFVNFELISADSASRVINLVSGSVDVVFWVVTISMGKISESEVSEGCLASEPYVTLDACVMTLAE